MTDHDHDHDPDHGHDGAVRELLHGAVGDMQPRHGLDGIRLRTQAARTRRSWAWGVGGTVATTAAAVAAVAALGGLPGSGDPAPVSGTSDTAVYFVGRTGAGLRLFPETQAVTGVRQALENAVAGTTSDPDYRSSWPAGTRVTGFVPSAGSASGSGSDGGTVQLSGSGLLTRPASLSAAEAALSVQQLVWTARSGGSSAGPVRFSVDGRDVGTLLGVDVSSPVPAGSADETLAAVQVSSPTDGARVGSPFTVTGRAAAFEGTVLWELRSGTRVVRRGFATAAECCTLAPYSFEVTAPSGRYTLVVHDQDVSGGEGGGAATQDTKTLTVR